MLLLVGVGGLHVPISQRDKRGWAGRSGWTQHGPEVSSAGPIPVDTGDSRCWAVGLQLSPPGNRIAGSGQRGDRVLPLPPQPPSWPGAQHSVCFPDRKYESK